VSSEYGADMGADEGRLSLRSTRWAYTAGIQGCDAIRYLKEVGLEESARTAEKILEKNIEEYGDSLLKPVVTQLVKLNKEAPKAKFEEVYDAKNVQRLLRRSLIARAEGPRLTLDALEKIQELYMKSKFRLEKLTESNNANTNSLLLLADIESAFDYLKSDDFFYKQFEFARKIETAIKQQKTFINPILDFAYENLEGLDSDKPSISDSKTPNESSLREFLIEIWTRYSQEKNIKGIGAQGSEWQAFCMWNLNIKEAFFVDLKRQTGADRSFHAKFNELLIEFKKIQQASILEMNAELALRKSTNPMITQEPKIDNEKYMNKIINVYGGESTASVNHGDLIEVKFIGNQTILVFGLREELRPQIASISLQIAGILREKFESDGLSVKQASPLQYEAQLALVISLQDVPSSSVAGLHEVITSALNKF
jgi:hypothetical protein